MRTPLSPTHNLNFTSPPPSNTDPPSAIDDSSSSIDLPVIDLSPHRVSSPFGRRQEMEAIMRSFTDVGFCLVKGIKERGYDAEELLRAAKWFFGEVDEGTRVEQVGLIKSRKKTYLFPIFCFFKKQ